MKLSGQDHVSRVQLLLLSVFELWPFDCVLCYFVKSTVYFLFDSFVKVGISYAFTIKMFSTAENCVEK